MTAIITGGQLSNHLLLSRKINDDYFPPCGCHGHSEQRKLEKIFFCCLVVVWIVLHSHVRSPLPDSVTSRTTMRMLATDDNISVSFCRVNLINQQMGCLYNVFLSVFTLISPSVFFIRSFSFSPFFCLSSSLLSSPSVHFSLHFVTQITLSLRHLFALCFPPSSSLPVFG